MQFEHGNSPAFWAIPQDPKERCEFPTVSAEGLPDSEDFHTAGEESYGGSGVLTSGNVHVHQPRLPKCHKCRSEPIYRVGHWRNPFSGY